MGYVVVISHEDNTVDFSNNKSLDVILQIFYKNTHIVKIIKIYFFFTLLGSVIILGTSSAKMQLLVCSVAQKCWKALEPIIKWDPVFSQMPGLVFSHLCLLLGLLTWADLCLVIQVGQGCWGKTGSSYDGDFLLNCKQKIQQSPLDWRIKKRLNVLVLK